MLRHTLQMIALCLTVAASSVDASDFPTLVGRIPTGSNSLVLIDIDAVLSSPIAKTNGWDRRFADGSVDRPLYLPPEADKVAIAAKLDLVRGCRKTWEVAVLGMKEPVSMSLIARAEGGYVDEIQGVKAAWVPSDAYFIEIDSKTLGLMAPADRQSIARWAERGKTQESAVLPGYLSTLTGAASKGAQVVMAVDAADAVQTHRIRASLEQSGLLQNSNLDSTVQLMSTLKGLTLQLTFTTKVEATARIDFGQPVSLKDDLAKNLVLGALEKMELSLPGTETWSCSVKDNSITLSGTLDNDALRRVFSLVDLPTTKFSSLKDENIEDDSQATTARCSKAYFGAVESMLTDLKKRGAINSAGDAGWIERYAGKIDQLPVLHVDEELLTYGEKVTETLRIMAGSRRITNMEGASEARASNDSYNNGYGYRAFSYTSPRATADATAKGTTIKIQGWTLIDNATLEIRKGMTQKYNVEF